MRTLVEKEASLMTRLTNTAFQADTDNLGHAIYGVEDKDNISSVITRTGEGLPRSPQSAGCPE
jgi:hypothetical protein